ncbi:MAG: putative transport system permease protein [Gaiellaceae bacterium]|nr:putative transport system permease protein [Gaiellaceae bacterium]
MRRVPPHWRKAPLTLLHHRPVLAAVVFGSFLVALAAASSPFFTAAAGSAALRDKLHEVTPLAAGLEISYIYAGGRFGSTEHPVGLHTARLDRTYRGQLRGVPLVGPPILTTIAGRLQVTRVNDFSVSDNVTLAARTGALDHVRRLAGDPRAPGIWIADTVADTLDLAPGGRLQIQVTDSEGGAKVVVVPVAGVYEALWRRTPRPYWVNFTRFIYPSVGRTDRFDPVLPATFAFVSQAWLERLYANVDPGGVEQDWEFPFTTSAPLLPDAKRVEGDLVRIRSRLRGERQLTRGEGAVATTALPTAVGLAEQTIAGVEPPTRLLSEAGALIALIVVGASGVFLVARRRSEARALFARGEAVSSFAARTLLEALLPSLAGGALGLAAALALIRVFEPRGAVDPGTLVNGTLAAAAGVGVGLLLVGASAGVAFARQYEVGRRTHPLLRRAPWELVALLLGLVLLLRLRHGGGLARDKATGISHPSLVSFLVPLLLVGGTATLVARLGTPPLGRAAARAWRLPLAVHLALRRLAAGRGVLALLVVTCAVALGLLLYAQTLVSSLRESVRQKAFIAAGSDAQGTVDASQPAPARFRFPVTRVELAFGGGRIGSEDGDPVDIAAIDPATFERAVHWYSSWGPPLASLLPRLDEPGPLHILVTGKPIPLSRLSVGTRQIPVTVTWVHAFPGMTANAPLVVLSKRALARRIGADTLDVQWAELWAKGPTDEVVAALRARPAEAFYTTTAVAFSDNPNVALALRTFGFMRALGIAAGALALFCMLLYLLARQRAQTIATAFGRRMGLARVTAAASLALELGAILAVAFVVATGGALLAAGSVVGHSDPLPLLPPSPVFAAPWLSLVVLILLLGCVAAIGGVVASRRPRDEALVEAIRLE